jgi:hypothetical protein
LVAGATGLEVRRGTLVEPNYLLPDLNDQVLILMTKSCSNTFGQMFRNEIRGQAWLLGKQTCPATKTCPRGVSSRNNFGSELVLHLEFDGSKSELYS